MTLNFLYFDGTEMKYLGIQLNVHANLRALITYLIKKINLLIIYLIKKTNLNCDFYFHQIISGCEWGNILVWDEGLIKMEVTGKNNKPCHQSYIAQFEYINGELYSIGIKILNTNNLIKKIIYVKLKICDKL